MAGELQDTLIADLNARGIPTVQGRPWTRPALKTLLTRQRNCGRIIYTDPSPGLTSVVGRLPGDPIVSEAVAEALTDRLGRGEITLAGYDLVIKPVDERIASLRAERAALPDPGPVPGTQQSLGTNRTQ